ncbi:MAG: sulfatase-like hydrolase/transferase, partial [Acidobacteriaceae bacterium]
MTATTLGALGINVERAAALTTTDADTEPAAAVPNPRRPNVLVLMSDQHKRSCMGVSGDSVASTPNLDRLAGESVRFTNAYCTNPVCGPSRASILTGLYTHNLLSRDVLEKRGDSSPYSPRHKTLAHHFSRADYLTALIGKMHFVDAQTHGFNYQLEFNDWYQALGPKVKLYDDEVGHPDTGAGLPQIASLWRQQGDPWKGHRQKDDRQGAVAVGRPSIMEEPDHFESFVARESIHFLENYTPDDEPFFLVSSFL